MHLQTLNSRRLDVLSNVLRKEDALNKPGFYSEAYLLVARVMKGLNQVHKLVF